MELVWPGTELEVLKVTGKEGKYSGLECPQSLTVTQEVGIHLHFRNKQQTTVRPLAVRPNLIPGLVILRFF